MYDKFSGSRKVATHLDHISHCEVKSGENWWNDWAYRMSIINTRLDQIQTQTAQLGTRLHSLFEAAELLAGHGFRLALRLQVNLEHVSQSRPNSGLGVKDEVAETRQVVPSSLKSGLPASARIKRWI